MRAPSAAAKGAAATGRHPSTNTMRKSIDSAIHAEVGVSRNCGTAIDRPYTPMPRPRCDASTRCATALDPQTVSTANPAPRTAESARIPQSSSVSANSSDGAPSSTIPTTSVTRHLSVRSAQGTVVCTSTVASISTALTRPAPPSSAPPLRAQSGAVGSSSAYPAKPSAEVASRAGMPGTRQTDPRDPTSSTMCRFSPIPHPVALLRSTPNMREGSGHADT